MPQQMASRQNQLSVVDVYDIAASIGKEFEKIIDNYGPDSVTELMPKVINVLEHLEEVTSQEQKECGEIEELKFQIERLHIEKTAKAEEREKYEKELEQIEETWKLDTHDLMNSVTQLQEENKQLKSRLREKEGQDGSHQKAMEEITIITDLQETIQKSRVTIRTLERELHQKNQESEAMQGQVERLARLNANMRHKTTVTQQRAQSLIQEQVDLQAQLHDKEYQILKIRDRMRDTDSSPPLSPDDLFSLQDKLEKQGKMVFDTNDPNRPRFTTNQLKDVLQEKNELKAKLIAVEEQLQQYKPPEPEPKDGELSPLDFDAPVYGPINKEPEDKLFPDRVKSSGIRKFFSFLISPNSSSSKNKLAKRRASQPYKSTPLQSLATSTSFNN